MTAEIRIRTVLLARTWAGGHCLLAPVAALDLASYGPEGHCADEQELFLGEHLARVAPEEAARFHLPEGVRLVTADVLVPRDELPRRVRVRTPLRVHAVVVPDAHGAWVTVAALDHTVYVPREEPLEDAIRDEVVRLAGAREITPAQYLELLPPERAELVPLELVVRPAERPSGGASSLRKALRERERAAWAREVLASVATPLHATLPREAAPLVAREAELRQLASLLDGPRRRSVLVTGPSLAGRTAVVHAWLRQRLARDPGAQCWATSGAALVAGMRGFGQWEERARRVMQAAEILDATLYFDDLADVVGERAQGHADLASAFAPWVSEGRVRVVAELREELVATAERAHPGLMAPLSRLRVEALDADAARQALALRAAHDARAGEVTPTARALDAVVDLAARYLPYERFPGKALRLYDALRAWAATRRGTLSPARPLDADDVHAYFSARSGVPLFLLRDDTALRLEDVARALSARVVGQAEAVRRVAEAVCVVKARLQPGGRPLATLLFVGPTGVGKTELARALAALLYGSDERMVRFDMSEYGDPEAVDRLARGAWGEEGLLTRRVRQQPFGVVLLDEIEKAHPSVFDLLLQVCGEARLTDGRGRTAWFHNTLVVMTSNLGATSLREAAGIAAAPLDPGAHYVRAVERAFRPEFVNRIDRIVAFSPLSPEDIHRVAAMAVARVCARRGFSNGRATLTVDDAAVARIARDAYSARWGARALRRHLEDHVVAPAARLLSSRGLAEGLRRLSVTATDAGLALTDAVEALEDDRDDTAIDRVSAQRRFVVRAMEYPRVEALRDQVDYLVHQLDHGARSEGVGRGARSVTALQRELHRLSAHRRALEALRDDVLALEELAFEGALDGAPSGDLVAEMDALRARFDRELAFALLALEPRRDEACVRWLELDGRRGLDRWLPALVEGAAQRGWELALHLDGDGDRDGTDWPAARRWGPPREGDDAVARVLDPGRSWRAVMARVRGPYAGALLALECGLRAWTDDDEEATHLWGRLVAMRWQLDDVAWDHPAAAPEGPAQWDALRAASPSRALRPNGWVNVRASRWVGPYADDAAYVEALERVAAHDLLAWELDGARARQELFEGALDARAPAEEAP